MRVLEMEAEVRSLQKELLAAKSEIIALYKDKAEGQREAEGSLPPHPAALGELVLPTRRTQTGE